MRALVQRVVRAQVTSRTEGSDEWTVVGEIGPGLCVFVGVTHSDNDDVARKLASKLWGLRIFDDADGVMNRSLGDVAGDAGIDAAVLVVSQFTLYGDVTKGRRPSWIDAARPEHAEPLVEFVAAQLGELGAEVATGRFRTEMRVELVNDGPVTIMVELSA